ncbi:MAG: sulfate permease [Saprospiraceae bacterium]|nr:sulfate permease [Saprospiraceae bacterium]
MIRKFLMYSLMQKFLPVLSWLPEYKKENLSKDFFAGITIGIMLIPQGMAYALLAGLPPIYGLYAGMVTLTVYTILGTSRQLSIGPVAMDSLILANGLAGLAVAGTNEYIALAVLLAMMVGLLQLSMGFFRLGFLVNFISNPVISGFSSAAAIIIAFSQLKHLLGITVEGEKVHEIIINIFRNIEQTHFLTFGLGIFSLVLLFGSRYLSNKIPSGLLTIIVSILLVYFFHLDESGVKILMEVPSGLPPFEIPDINKSDMLTLLPLALTLAFVSFMESIASAKTIQMKHKDYEVVPNQELIALGASNLATSFFKGMPVAGSFTRSALNNDSGAKTGLSSFISALVLLIVLLFFTSGLYYLPYTVLAAIIIYAVAKLVNIRLAAKLWKSSRKDFIVFMATGLATLFIDIEAGITTGVLISLGLLIHGASYPHIAELGRIPTTRIFRNIERFQNLERYDSILIVRFDAQLFFANAHTLLEFVEAKIRQRPSIKHVILEASAINGLDATAVDMLIDINNDLKSRGIELYMVNVKGMVRDVLESNGLIHERSTQYYFLNTHDAVSYILGSEFKDFTEYVLQTNIKSE